MKSINKKIIISGMCYASPLLLLLVLFFSCNNAHAVTFESEQGVAFTFNPTVTISITGGTGTTNDGLTITNLTPGDVKDSNIITVSASANTPLGYSLSSTVGSSTYNTTELRKDGTSTANKFTNLSINKASLSNFDDNTWGYSYSTDSGSTWISGDITSTTNAGYNGLPIYTTSSPIKLINSNTAGSSSVQFKIGAKASTSQIAGTYNNVINFIGTSKVVTTTYTINYNANAGSDTVTNMPTPNPLQGTDTTGNAAIQISSNVPVRENYMFKGWCTSQTSDDTCSSDVVQPGGLVALNPGTSSPTANVTKTLYAMWKSNMKTVTFDDAYAAAGKTKQGNYYKMQDGTSSICSAVTEGQIGQLIDTRDNETYYVGKLADGKCWMLDNLRLGGSSAMNLAPSDTNINSNWTLPASTTTRFDDTGWTTAAVNADYKNTTTTSYGAGSGKIGNYYNFCAASGGTYCYASGSGTGDAQYDICPAGWRMPTGGDYQGSGVGDGEYFALGTALGLTFDEEWWGFPDTTYLTALSTPLSGFFFFGSASFQGELGSFWSSTWNDGTSMYRLYVDSDGASPTLNNDRCYGNSLRCVLDS